MSETESAFPTFPALVLQVHTTNQPPSCGSRDPSSGPRACAANPLLSHPQPVIRVSKGGFAFYFSTESRRTEH